MTKKIAIVLVILLLTTCLFTACAKEDYSFTALTGDTSGEVISNGGMAVQKGNYVYFVNGAVANTMNNTFGEVLEGSIVRVLATDLDILVGTDTTNSIADTNSDGVSNVSDVAEVVVPKIVYTAYSTTKTDNGFFIYGDRIYYTTPSTSLDKNGSTEYSKLSVKSCNLNGTDTVNHYTFDSSSLKTSIVEANGSVWLVYIEDAKLYSAKLDGKDVNPTEICEVSSILVNPTNSTVYLLNVDSNIMSAYKPGNEVVQVYPLNNAEPESGAFANNVTLKFVSDGAVYFTISDTNLPGLTSGIYKVSSDNAVSEFYGYVPTSFYVYKDYLITYSSDYKLNVRDTTLDDSNDEILQSTALSSSPTFIGVVDNYLYYTVSSALHRTLLVENDALVTSLTYTKMASGTPATATAAAWATYDIVGDYCLYFGSTAVTIAGDEGGTVYPVMALPMITAPTSTDIAGYDITFYTVISEADSGETDL